VLQVGDLVRNKNAHPSMNASLGILVRWRTFDEKSNPYTCPEVFWFDGRLGTIQASLIEVISNVE